MTFVKKYFLRIVLFAFLFLSVVMLPKQALAFICGTQQCSAVYNECCRSDTGNKPICLPCDGSSTGGQCSTQPGTVQMTVPGTSSTVCCPSGSTVVQTGTYTVTSYSPYQVCGPYTAPLSNTPTGNVDADDNIERTYVCPNYSCNSSAACVAGFPSGLAVTATSATTATMSWLPGNKGKQQILGFGPIEADVNNGCYTGTCLATDWMPDTAYSAPTTTFSPAIVMYYYSKTSRSCGSTQPKSTIAQCEADVINYVPNTTETCYVSAAICESYNVDNYNLTGLAGTYYARIANYRDSSCYKNTTSTYCATKAPTVPSLSSPANGSNSTVTNITLRWSDLTDVQFGYACPAAAQSNQYDVYIGTTASNMTLRTTTSLADGTTSYPFTASLGSTYYWKVVAKNGSLSTSSATWSFTVSSLLTGTVFNDVNNNCTGTGMSGVGLTLSNGTTATTVGNGTYSLSKPSGTFTLTTAIPAGYLCSTGACGNCPSRSVSTAGPFNFYLTQSREAWWQVVGGGAYAGASSGASIGSTIPSSVTAANRYLVLPGTTGTAAAVMRASSSAPDTGSGSVSTSLWSARSSYKGKRMDYDYFAAQMGVLPTTQALTNLASKPASGQEFYYISGNQTLGAPWSVLSGESYVIFVNGNLDINSNITVATGGFLTFIVNGNIAVGASVTSLHGLYVADANFVTTGPTNVAQLDIQGTVAAWGSFSLERDLSASNLTLPAEKFTYRSDLVANMPRKMKTFTMQWSEVAPGTFDN